MSIRKHQYDTVDSYVVGIMAMRRQRAIAFRKGPFSELALVHRHFFTGRKELTLGSHPDASICLDDKKVAPIHAVVEPLRAGWKLRAVGKATIWTLGHPPKSVPELLLRKNTSFRMGRFNLRYIVHSKWGPLIEVYDSRSPAVRKFKRMDYFPVNPEYRVEASFVPRRRPMRVRIIYTDGQERPLWSHGELHFQLLGRACKLDAYSEQRDIQAARKEGFLLMFTDLSSGEDSYPAGRYLRVRGTSLDQIILDFNQAYNPPCNYSPVFNCPIPQRNNQIPVAVLAGQRLYRLGGLR